MTDLQRLLYRFHYAGSLIALVRVWPFLPSWLQLFVVVCGLLGWFRTRLVRAIPMDRLTTLVVVIAGVLLTMQLSFANVAEPLVYFLTLLLAARLISEKTPRNILQSLLLSVLLLGASSLLTLDMWYLLYLVLMVAVAGSGLILLCFVRLDPNLQLDPKAVTDLRRYLCLVPLTTLVLMFGFFFILPRTPVPLWNVIGSEPVALVGMTDQVQPGTFSSLAATGETAFRVEIDELPAAELYWRGIVLDHFDGRTWRRGSGQGAERLPAEGSKRRTYQIFAEPKTDPYLMTLDRSDRLEGIAHRRENDGVFVRRHQDFRRTSYRASAVIGGRAVYSADRSVFLKVPENIPRRLREAADELVVGTTSTRDRIDRLETFFIGLQLSYSAQGLTPTDTPLTTFLFEDKRGYCEHFASSFAVMLRLMEVPTRLVGGYLGGIYNHFGNYYLVKEDRAHVWVEVLTDDGIWERHDPSRLAVNAEAAFLTVAGGGRNYLEHISDALFHSWTRRVLNYDLQQQFQLLTQAGAGLSRLDRIEITAPIFILPALLPVLIAVVLVVRKYRRRGRNDGLVRRYLRQIARCAGLKYLPPDLGLYQLADLTDEPLCREFADIYGPVVYADGLLSPAHRDRLRQIIRELRQKRFFIDVAMPGPLGDNDHLAAAGCISHKKGNLDALHRSQYHERGHQRTKGPTG